MNSIRYAGRVLLLLLSGLLVMAAGFLLWLTLTDFRPANSGILPLNGTAGISPRQDMEIGLLSWNIGYAGLGKDMDFFYDGGSKVRAPLAKYQEWLNGIYSFLAGADTLDIIMLQETDMKAKRSYYINQVDVLAAVFAGFTYSFAVNYDVPFIPFPVLSPMGKVSSGLLSLSRFTTHSAARISAPVNFSWPRRLFFPDRCLLMLRIPVWDGKELVVINLHQSAWEEGAALRKRETELIRETVLHEYEKGNYVIAGGDWNQNPPGLDTCIVNSDNRIRSLEDPMPAHLLPQGWQWAFSLNGPTNRDLHQTYIEGTTTTTLIDYYLVSPNIKVTEITTLDLDFQDSDHQPVYLRVSLLPDSLTGPHLSLPQ